MGWGFDCLGGRAACYFTGSRLAALLGAATLTHTRRLQLLSLLASLHLILPLIEPLYSDLHILLIDGPSVLPLYFEVNPIPVNQPHLIVVPNLEGIGLDLHLTAQFILIILIDPHSLANKFDWLLVIP